MSIEDRDEVAVGSSEGIETDEATENLEIEDAVDVGEAAEDDVKTDNTGTLTFEEVNQMFTGFNGDDFIAVTAPTKKENPIVLTVDYGVVKRRYSLWVFSITPGGGSGPKLGKRKPTERRIQITSGPREPETYNDPYSTTLLIGYYHALGKVVVLDRRWLERYTDRVNKPVDPKNKEKRESNSAQVDLSHFGPVSDDRIYLATKTASFGLAESYVMRKELLPSFLATLDHSGKPNDRAAPVVQTRDRTQTVLEFCRIRNFHFEPEILARYIASIVSKPFVILAGVSGTGKSKLAELVAEYYSLPFDAKVALPEEGDPEVAASGEYIFRSRMVTSGFGRSTLVAVRTDWMDNKAILGFMNPVTGGYESTLTLDIILRALANPDERHFLLLDEMNLAKVEHYFSDWLACSESRRAGPDGTIIQQEVSLHRASGEVTATVLDIFGTDKDVAIPKTLALPVNLIVTGTVNMDDTTNGFSPKVLDRSMVIEFDQVDLNSLRSDAPVISADGYRFPEQLPGFELAATKTYTDLPAATHGHIAAINRILEDSRLHIGYRSAIEIASFLRSYERIIPVDEGDTDLLRGLDVAILQQVLPRVGGTQDRIEKSLARLCHYLRYLSAHPATPDIRTFTFEPDPPARMPKSYRRSLEMWKTLDEFGYVTFFK